MGSFLIGVNFQVFQLLLNLYLRERGILESQIGQIISMRALGMTLIAIPAAILLSKIKLKPILILSSILFAVFSFLISSVDATEMIAGFSLLGGMSFAFYRVAAAPFYMRNSTPKERTHLFSFSFGMMLLSGMVGSIGTGQIVTMLAEHSGSMVLGYRYAMYIGISLGIFSLIPFFMIKATKPSADENKILLSKIRFKDRGKFYLKLTSCNFLVGLGAGLIIPFLNLYFQDRFDMSPEAIGLSYFSVQFAMFFGTLSGPILAKKFGLVRTVVFTQIASIPFMLILSYSSLLPLAIIAFIMRGGLMNLGVPIVSNLGMELSDNSDRGLVNALLMVSWTSSWMISSAVGGSIIENYGYTVTMNITTVLYLMSSFLFYYFFKDVETKNEVAPGWTIFREGTIR